MKILEKITVLEACQILQADLLNKGNLLTNFILENYGDITYSLIYDDIHYLEYSKLRLYDEKTQDRITVVRRGSKAKIGEETLAIYHSSPLNNAKASYNFLSNYKNTKIIYHGMDISTKCDEAYITKTHFVANEDEIIEQYVEQTKILDKNSEEQLKNGINNFNHYVKNNKVKVLSRRNQIFC